MQKPAVLPCVRSVGYGGMKIYFCAIDCFPQRLAAASLAEINESLWQQIRHRRLGLWREPLDHAKKLKLFMCAAKIVVEISAC